MRVCACVCLLTEGQGREEEGERAGELEGLGDGVGEVGGGEEEGHLLCWVVESRETKGG